MEALKSSESHEELVIDTMEGLVDFFAYAQDAFHDFKESAATCPSEELCAPYLKQAEDAYEEIQSLVERHCKVLDLGGFLTEEDAEEIQTLYNKIITAQDGLEATLNPDSESDDNNTEGDPVRSFYMEEIDEEETDYDEISRRNTPSLAQGSLHITDETESTSSHVAIRHVSIDSEAFRRNLNNTKTSVDTLVSKAETMLHEYQEMSESTEDEENFRNGVLLYQQLKASADSIKDLSFTIVARMNTPVAEDAELFLQHVADELKEYEEGLSQIDAGLSLYFDEPESIATESSPLPSTEAPKAAKENQFEVYRSNLFSKNEMRPAIEKVAAVPEYKKFLSEYFTSPGAFEAYLRREINVHEKVSKFDSVFGIVRKSPFDTLLRDMPLQELESFDRQPTEALRHVLLEKDIQYEMYVDWMHDYEVMKQMIHTTPTMTFGELYVRAMVEELMDRQLTATA